MNRTFGWVAAISFVGTVVLANWLVAALGIVSIGFGMSAPAAVFVAGLAFTLRDIVQRQLGKSVVVGSILVGAGVSTLVAEPTLAIASGTAFLVSEFADFAVYTPLRERGWMRAVLASNIVGLVVDSMLFLWLAFGSLAFLPGQITAKAAMTLLAIGALFLARRRAPVLV